jgi:predicted metal-dependent hydrolase
MIHLKNSGYAPRDAPLLLKKVDHLISGLDSIIRDTRVSRKYLEFDVSINKENLDQLLEKLELIGKLYEARHLVEEKMEKEEAMEKARSYFNNERFWECHEVLEGIWKKTHEGEKDLLQGIILVAAAFVHYQKNENEICLSIMDRAMEKLQNAIGIYHEIDVDGFKRKISEIIRTKMITTFTV